MAYFVAKSCGGLRLNSSDFTEVDSVITSGSMTVDTYTPTYSTGVTAKFNQETYQTKAGKTTKTFTATVVDTTTTWSDGTNTVTMSEYGLTDIAGTVDGSTITVTHATEEVPRTELVGDPFVAPCGGVKFDDGVFAQVGRVITTAGTTVVSGVVRGSGSLQFDANKFELGDDKEIALA